MDRVISKLKRLIPVAKDDGNLKMGSYNPIGPVNPDFRATGSCVLSTSSSNTHLRDIYNPSISWAESPSISVPYTRMHSFSLLPLIKIWFSISSLFSTIYNESLRRRRIRPPILVIFLQIILYQLFTHLAVGSFAPSSLHSPKGKSQSAPMIPYLYTSILVIIYLFSISILNFAS